jgi:hypothetical protein
MTFISRKELEIRHPQSYEFRSRLKELGCQWDGIAKAWIAPSDEVKELCYELLDRDSEEKRDSTPRRSFIRTPDISEIDDFLNGVEHDRVDRENQSIAYEPTKEDAQLIVGLQNVLRYWKDEVPSVVSELLASGKETGNKLFNQLEEAGWKNRQISLLFAIVDRFRAHPPIHVNDEILTMPVMLSKEAVNPDEMAGSISVLSDSEGTPVAFKVEFSYQSTNVNKIKWVPGAKWIRDRKYWQVPIESAKGNHGLFDMFAYFKRSQKAKAMEANFQGKN